MNKFIEKYKAVGEETRLRILRILIKADKELCVCEVVDTLQKPQYSISKALTTLKNAELVEERRDGKYMLYSLKKESPVNRKIFESIAQLPENDVLYQNDFSNLTQRSSLRSKVRCEVKRGIYGNKREKA
ncbi:MAG: metalloregulator ArsR/SmtB family transcription factor [Spirochaetota bacterium]